MADLLVDYCLEIEAGQHIVVRSSSLATPLLIELQRAILEREAWPRFDLSFPGQARGFYEHARSPQLDDFDNLAMAEAKGLSAVLGIQAPYETGELNGIDPARIQRALRGRAPVRERALSRRWCSTLWPTPAAASLAGMSLSDYAAFVAGATFLDRPDPVAAWNELRAFQHRLIERLGKAKELRIQGEGTDLTLQVHRRTWVNSDGRRNMPSGEVFTGPHETSAQGTIRFGVPSAPAGIAVDGVELTFRDGEVVDARAQVGEDYLREAIATDPGARRLGEIGIGTNFGIRRPTGTILFDEKIGGTVHLALGRSYPETGGRNQSALHWDLICDLRDGGSLSLDGEPLLVDRRFAGL
ncbi:MAG: aminopeptidase [Actinobacteria bacterium]|nr:aminopeptidase [Actinomycetota bacterium]